MQRNEKVPGCQGKRGRVKRGEVKIRKWGRRVSKECRGCQDRTGGRRERRFIGRSKVVEKRRKVVERRPGKDRG